VATSDAAFRGGACPTPEYTIAYTGNYTTSADANMKRPSGRASSINTATLHTTRNPQPAKAYPNAALGEFGRWFRHEYLIIRLDVSLTLRRRARWSRQSGLPS